MNLNLFENKYFFAVFAIFMFMYAAQIRQPLPKFMMDLFQNPIFRVGILFLVLVRGYKDPQFSLIVSVAFVLIMNTVNEQLFKETFVDTHINEYFSQSDNKAIETECSDLQHKIHNIDTCIASCNNETSEEHCSKLGSNRWYTSTEFDEKCSNVKYERQMPEQEVNCDNY